MLYFNFDILMKGLRMRIIQLIYLLDLYKTRSLSKTANNFFVSRQSVNYDLKELERIYAVTLYNYKNNTIEFTEEGELMVRKAKKIIDAYSDFEKTFPNKKISKSMVSGNIDIIATPRISNSLLPQFLRGFLKEFPYIKIAFKQRTSADIINTIVNAPNLLGIITAHNNNFNVNDAAVSRTLNTNDVEIIPLATLDFYVCVAKDSPWASMKFFSLEDIQDSSNNIPLIGYKDLIQEWDNGNLHYTYTVSDIRAQQQFIADNLGIGLVSSAEYNLFYKNKKKFLFKPLYYSASNNKKVDYSYLLLANRERSEQENLFIEKFHQFLTKYK